MIFPLISCLFLIVAIVCFLHLTPKQIAEDVLELTVKEPTLRDQVRALRTGKQKKSNETPVNETIIDYTDNNDKIIN